MSLNAHVQPIFEKLQLLDELKTISLLCQSLDTYADKLELLGGLDFTFTTYSEIQKKKATYRSLITFLPPVPNKTDLKLDYQQPSKRFAREQAARNEAKGTDAVEI
ncbi:hypothetical protein BGZ81_000719 [Podila clonocystis]|nr:hypothetical protein BGZ81_000719 [Podila clonocystis]